jgi:hypothetical protein
MSRSHHRRIGRQAAEQLLDGSAGPGAGPDQLARVLAAAAAAGRESELSGEQAAMAAFEAHHLVPVPASRRGQMIKSPLAKLLTVKVLAIATAAFATGGVALAASNGALSGSGPATGHAISQSASPAGIAAGRPTAPASTAPATLPSAPAPASPPASGGTAPGGAAVVAGATALCRTLAARVDPAGQAAGLEQALASPRVPGVAGGSMFASLVATAHGVAHVPDYCGLLLDLPQLPQPDGLSQLPAPVLAKALTQLPTGTLAQILTALPAAELSQVLTSLPATALSQVLTSLPASALSPVLTALPAAALSQVLTSLPASALSQVLTTLPAATLSQMLTRLPAADLAQVLGSLPASVRSRILGELPTSVLSQLPHSGLLNLPG